MTETVAEMTMDNVYAYFERLREEWNEKRKSPGNSDLRTDWIERKAVEDLRNGNPDYALDHVSWVQGPFTHSDSQDEDWIKDYGEARRVMEFLEKEFGREGCIHNLDRR